MKRLVLSMLALMMVVAVGHGQTTMPVKIDRGALEIRANLEFNRAQYAAALPMLKALADMSKDQPDLVPPIEEKIRVCERNIADNAGKTAAAVAVAEPRTPHAVPKPGQTLAIDIKALGNFDYDSDKGGNIPADVTALTGSTIRLHGFMIPMDQAANITQFALVPDLFSCCFGQPPQLQHTIVCSTPKGKAVGYYPDEITVEGKLKVGEKKDEGFIVSIFEVDVSSVKPSPK